MVVRRCLLAVDAQTSPFGLAIFAPLRFGGGGRAERRSMTGELVGVGDDPLLSFAGDPDVALRCDAGKLCD